MVNVQSPSNGKYGSVSTTEYNEENDVTRTLTPDNRATALEAGEKSVEVATLLEHIQYVQEQVQQGIGIQRRTRKHRIRHAPMRNGRPRAHGQVHRHKGQEEAGA